MERDNLFVLGLFSAADVEISRAYYVTGQRQVMFLPHTAGTACYMRFIYNTPSNMPTVIELEPNKQFHLELGDHATVSKLQTVIN